jgi:hypothetical protein
MRHFAGVIEIEADRREVAGDLQRAGLISYSRGNLHIVDVAKVRERACECHDAVRSHYDAIFRAH